MAPVAAQSRQKLGPVTPAGWFLDSYSPLSQVAGRSAKFPSVQGRSVQPLLAAATRHEAAYRWSKAIAALQQAVRLAPGNAAAHYQLGIVRCKMGRTREGAASLQRAVGLQPDFGRAHLGLGVALQDLGHEADAIAALRTAIALRTGVREAHARLGDLLRAQGDAAGAAENYRKAADDTTGGRLSRAKALMAEQRLDEAETTVRRAVALDPTSSEAAWMLGNILLNLGRLEEAARESERAIALMPQAVGPYYTRALAKRFTAVDRPLVAQMETVLRTAPLSDVSRMKLQYTLGKVYDDLGEHADAILHFDAANRLDRTLAVYNRAAKAALVDSMIARYTPDYLKHHADLSRHDETPVFILGMPRSGTTLVEQIVSSHRQVAGGGELDFWIQRGLPLESEGAEPPDVATARALADDYLGLLRQIAPDAMRVTDKMPHNFQVVGLIHLIFPRARIIHCRRHPVDTCLSIYFTQFRQRMNFASDRADLVYEYRQYERQMAHWRALLPPDRLLDIDYESLIADREAQTRRLVEFCGLDWDEACLRPEHNERVVTTASLWQARQPVYSSSVGRWRGYAPWLGVLRELLPPEEHGRDEVDCE